MEFITSKRSDNGPRQVRMMRDTILGEDHAHHLVRNPQASRQKEREWNLTGLGGYQTVEQNKGKADAAGSQLTRVNASNKNVSKRGRDGHK